MKIFFVTADPHPFGDWLSEQKPQEITFATLLVHFFRLVDDPGCSPINDTKAWCEWPGGWARLEGLSFHQVDCFGDGMDWALEAIRENRFNL